MAVPIPDKLFFRIGEVAALTAVPPYVLRYWESEFKLLRPRKNPAGQRVYRRPDVELVLRIRGLLYDERLTLEGAKKRLLREARQRAQQLELPTSRSASPEVVRELRIHLEGMRAVLRRSVEVPLDGDGSLS